MEAVGGHKKGFKLLSSNSEAIGQPCKGFSLIEAAIVLAVVGGVIGGIWVSAAAVIENYKVSKTAEGILTTARNIQDLISIRDSEAIGELYITNQLIAAGVFPKDWVDGTHVWADGTHANHPFGGIFYASNYINPSRADLVLVDIPRSACIKLLVKISSMEAIFRFFLIQTGEPRWSTTTYPISLDTAKTACNRSTNMLAFTISYTRNN